MDESPQIISCRCCIVGGGPAGMMVGLLFARAGVDTIVLAWVACDPLMHQLFETPRQCHLLSPFIVIAPR